MAPTNPPTGAPVEPTDAPVDPTDAPTNPPTGAPVEPTDAPVDPTDPPLTDSPTEFPTFTPTDVPTIPDSCVNDSEWRYRGQNRKSCAWLTSRNWTDAKKLKWCNRRANNPKSDKTRVWAYCKELCYGLGKTQACP